MLRGSAARDLRRTCSDATVPRRAEGTGTHSLMKRRSDPFAYGLPDAAVSSQTAAVMLRRRRWCWSAVAHAVWRAFWRDAHRLGRGNMRNAHRIGSRPRNGVLVYEPHPLWVGVEGLDKRQFSYPTLDACQQACDRSFESLPRLVRSPLEGKKTHTHTQNQSSLRIGQHNRIDQLVTNNTRSQRKACTSQQQKQNKHTSHHTKARERA